MKRIIVKEEYCMGCRLCEVYCRLSHSISKDPVTALKNSAQAPLARTKVEIKKPVSISLRCQHCEEASCLYACLTGALRKEADGAVLVDENKCIGCWTCILVCPYGSIIQDKSNHKMVKCDMCGGKEPACVANCPNEALSLVEIPDLIPTESIEKVGAK